MSLTIGEIVNLSKHKVYLNGKNNPVIVSLGMLLSCAGKFNEWYTYIDESECKRECLIDDIDIDRTLGKLVVDIKQFKNVVITEILHQSDSVKNTGELVSNGVYSIESYAIPNITRDELYIRGFVKSEHNRVSCYNFKNEEEANEWISNIKELIKEINKPNPKEINTINEFMNILKKEKMTYDPNEGQNPVRKKLNSYATSFFNKKTFEEKYNVKINVEGLF